MGWCLAFCMPLRIFSFFQRRILNPVHYGMHLRHYDISHLLESAEFQRNCIICLLNRKLCGLTYIIVACAYWWSSCHFSSLQSLYVFQSCGEVQLNKKHLHTWICILWKFSLSRLLSLLNAFKGTLILNPNGEDLRALTT